MEPSGISPETKRRVAALFPLAQQDEVSQMLVNHCGSNLPGLSALNPVDLERFQFAALKLSQGNLVGLQKAINLANQDWRDLLMAAGFGYDPSAHKTWWPQ